MNYLNLSDIPYSSRFFKTGVVHINSETQLVRQLSKREGLVLTRLDRIEKALALGQGLFQIVSDGLSSYQDGVLREAGIAETKRVLDGWHDRIRADKDLRFPHQKILKFLLDQYDYARGQFKATHVSRLVREARVGKNMAKGYLALLQNKGYLESWSDGYRTWFRLRPQSEDSR